MLEVTPVLERENGVIAGVGEVVVVVSALFPPAAGTCRSAVPSRRSPAGSLAAPDANTLLYLLDYQ